MAGCKGPDVRTGKHVVVQSNITGAVVWIALADVREALEGQARHEGHDEEEVIRTIRGGQLEC